MTLRTVMGAVCASVLVAGAIGAAAPASAATAAETAQATLAAAGINSSQLAPGWSIVGNEVVWDGGHVRRSLTPPKRGPQALPCYGGALCLFEDADFLGNQLVFDNIGDVGRYLSLVPYGFNDKMSSWYDYRPTMAYWYPNVGGSPNPAHCMGARKGAEHLSAADNDKASMIYIFQNTAVC